MTPPSSLHSYALYVFYVEAKGIEPLLEEPKSSVLTIIRCFKEIRVLRKIE